MQILDSNQEIIDQISDLFDMLIEIKKRTVDSVTKSILKSFWSKTEENVQELGAFLLQTIDSNISLHHHLADLLFQLDKESNKTNKLGILVPLIVKNLLKKFGENFANCSMIYNLYKKGIISRDEISRQLKLKTEITNKNFNENRIRAKDEDFITYNCIPLGKIEKISVNYNILQWFWPEIIEINKIRDVNLLNALSHNSYSQNILSQISLDTISLEKFKKMRDNGEPDNELTLALRHDDIEKLQSIASNIHSRFDEQKVPYNIFEDFVPNGNTKYLNYAAAYGSIKCFKYILLNHDKIDDKTFSYAIYGGNLEIIKIVEQKLKDGHVNQSYMNSMSFNNQIDLFDPILLSVVKHQNDLFEWVIEDRLAHNKLDISNLSKIIQVSTKNGNAYSISVIFDKFFEIYIKLSDHEVYDIQDLFMTSSENGFFLLTKILINLFQNEKPGSVWNSRSSSNSGYNLNGIPDHTSNSNDQFNIFEFGNLSIVKLFIKQMDQKRLENILIKFFENGNIHIIKYFFENLLKEKAFEITQELYDQLLHKSANAKSSELFDYLMEQVKQADPTIIDKYVWKTDILQLSCEVANVKVAKTITYFILNQSQSNNDDILDFTISFAAAAVSGSKEICQFFVDKKVPIDFDKLASKNYNLDKISVDIFSLIIDNSLPEVRKKIYSNLYIPAILSHNKSLVDRILKDSPDKNNGLIAAVNSRDVEMVQVIINYINDPSFINTTSKEGTALIYAAKNDDTDIVKVLLSVPGIDPNLYDSERNTPLIISADNLNFDIFNAILDFYGDNIQYELWQVEKIVHNISANNNNNNNYINNYNINFNWKTNSTVFKFFNRILDIKCIDSSIFDNNNKSFLMCACEANDLDLVKKLLKLDKINVNLYDSKTGNTPLFVSLQNENYEISKLLINHPKIDINAKSFSKQTALIFAVQRHMDSITDLILNHGKFDAKKSLLNYAYTLSTDETIECFSKIENIDVNDNSIFPDYHPLLIHAVENNNKNMAEIIINHPSFDRQKSRLYEAIFKASSRNEIDIFKILITLVEDDFTKYKYLGKSILYYIPSTNSSMQNHINVDEDKNENYILTEVLNNYDFEFDKQDINDCWERFFVNSSYTELKQLFEYDTNHNHYINLNKPLINGDLYLTADKTLCNIEMINFLLENGADPNIPDKSNNYPLAIAIRSGDRNAVKALIDSNKVDFNKKIPIQEQNNSEKIPQLRFFGDESEEDSSDLKYTTYLHLAAKISRTNDDILSMTNSIFGELLNINGIDINMTDSIGNTPLMVACMERKIENIGLLFQKDNLDYFHRNKKGKDALKIIKNCSMLGKSNNNNNNENDYKEEKLINKNEYYDKIMNLIRPQHIGFSNNFSFNFGNLSFSNQLKTADSRQPNESDNSSNSTGFGFTNASNHAGPFNNAPSFSFNFGKSASSNPADSSKTTESDNSTNSTELGSMNAPNHLCTFGNVPPSAMTADHTQLLFNFGDSNLSNQTNGSQPNESDNSSNSTGFCSTNTPNHPGPFGSNSTLTVAAGNPQFSFDIGSVAPSNQSDENLSMPLHPDNSAQSNSSPNQENTSQFTPGQNVTVTYFYNPKW